MDVLPSIHVIISLSPLVVHPPSLYLYSLVNEHIDRQRSLHRSSWNYNVNTRLYKKILTRYGYPSRTIASFTITPR